MLRRLSSAVIITRVSLVEEHLIHARTYKKNQWFWWFFHVFRAEPYGTLNYLFYNYISFNPWDIFNYFFVSRCIVFRLRLHKLSHEFQLNLLLIGQLRNVHTDWLLFCTHTQKYKSVRQCGRMQEIIALVISRNLVRMVWAVHKHMYIFKTRRGLISFICTTFFIYALLNVFLIKCEVKKRKKHYNRWIGMYKIKHSKVTLIIQP